MLEVEATLRTADTLAESRSSLMGKVRPEWMVFGSVCFAAAGQLVMKAGLSHGMGLSPAAIVLLGLSMYGLGTLLWIRAVSLAEISYLYPLSAINYPLVAMGGKLFFHEAVHRERWLGILVMTIGIAILARTANRGTA
jgi:drug/metabolite transporter (DMT)-like permease